MAKQQGYAIKCAGSSVLACTFIGAGLGLANGSWAYFGSGLCWSLAGLLIIVAICYAVMCDDANFKRD